MTQKQSHNCWKIRAGGLWLIALCNSPATEISTFQTGDGGWQLAALAVGNLDSSPDLEIVVPYRDTAGDWFLDAFKYTGQRLPGFPYASGAEPINVSPTLCDLDGDGREEIIFTRGAHVIALRGDGSVMWSNTVDAASYVPNGGYQTVTNGFYWYPTGAWLDHLPDTARFFSEVSPPIVTDLNGTGNYEVITAWKIQPDPLGGGQDYNPFIFPIYGVGPWGAMGETWSGGIVTFNARTGGQNCVYHLHHLVESGLAIGQPEASGPARIYALNDSDSVVCFDKSQPFGLWGKGMLHRQFGKNQRLMSGSYLVPIDVYTADIDGDGLDEVLVAGTQLSSMWEPNETILDDDGAVLWRRWLPHLDFTNNCGWLNSACLIPVNPDHDNHIDVLGFNHSYEITFRYWNGVELVDRPGWPKNFYPYLPTPPVVGDVDGDGNEEIIIGTYQPEINPSSGNLLIYALDGSLKKSIPVPGGIKQIPALADVEGIGRLDVVYRSLTGRVYVENFGATGTNHVSWATHRGNMRRDGNHGVRLFPPGTPLVNIQTPAYNRASFSWTNDRAPQLYRIYRADEPKGVFSHIATVTGNITDYTDFALKAGCQYVYEVGAVYGTNVVRSAPFVLLSLLNNNLVANSGFERNENCRWDKWFTGNVAATNMIGTTNLSYQGKQCLQIRLENQSDNGTVAQYNQYGIPDSSISVTPGSFYSFGGFINSPGISQASEHWLEWSSTKNGYDTNNRPPLPDPFYFTPHVQIGPAGTDWTYFNRTFQLPNGFPNLEIRHRYSIAAPGTGSVFLDNVFFREIPAPSSSTWATLIGFGSSWRYFTNTPVAGWYASDFNDSTWSIGRAKFGAGSGPTNVATPLPQLLPAYFFRKQFVTESVEFDELLLAATCTDVSVSAIYPLRVFLNGTELKTFIDTVTLQGNETRYFDLTPFSSLLRPGTNTLAVQIGNCWSDYDDVAFDVCLKGVPYQPLSPHLSLQCSGTNSPSLYVQAPPMTIWQLQCSDSVSTGNWQPLQVFTNTTGTTVIPTDFAQPRSQPAQKFYRLVPY
ncbi:MAG TPA: hypothetical protein VL361_01715 [Candidatus Limnocylindrales bacterium]|nr:hypothetical protein [Candidatus Limnocylindrales bacterium]